MNTKKYIEHGSKTSLTSPFRSSCDNQTENVSKNILNMPGKYKYTIDYTECWEIITGFKVI
jgi:hypothetical protein